ncbi:hypothetical protein Ddep01_00931 [Deinococcus depolymerans]
MTRPDPAPARSAPSPAATSRPPYVPPHLTALGPWKAVTLAISVPIGPGGLRLRDHQF